MSAANFTMSGPGATPFNTQAMQPSQENSQGANVNPGTSTGGGGNAGLAAALGGQENLVTLLNLFAQMNKNAIQEYVGKLVDEKLAAAMSNSDQSAIGRSPTPGQETTAVGTSHGEEVDYRLKPKLELDGNNQPKGTEAINELNATVRNVYERNLKSWEKWVDQTLEKKKRMILEVRQHFKNGNLLNNSTIRLKLGAAGRNRREYLHSVIKQFDIGEYDQEKLRKTVSEEAERELRELQKSKLNQTAQLSQKKKKIFIHRLGAGGVQKFKAVFEKKTGKKATNDIIAKAKKDGIASVLAEFQILSDHEDFTSEDDAEGDEGDADAEADEDEELDEALLFTARPGSNSKGGLSSGGGPSSSQGKKKQKRVSDSQFVRNPNESDEEEEEELRRDECRKKAESRHEERPAGVKRKSKTSSVQTNYTKKHNAR